MSYRTYSKLEVACEQLEVALRLFFEGKEYFAVITLAGAAEEILGKHVNAQGAKNSVQELVDGAARIKVALLNEESTKDHFPDETNSSSEQEDKKALFSVANFARNAAKHMNATDPNDAVIEVFPKKATEDLLNRTVDNYYRLMNYVDCCLQETESVRKFSQYRTSANNSV
jgi:hypothetical protein